MAILFKMNEDGKVKLCGFGISNGTKIIPCESEDKAEKLCQNSRYTDYSVINSDEPSKKLIETLKGVRFDSMEDAEDFINGGGYAESVPARVEDLENIIAEVIGGDTMGGETVETVENEETNENDGGIE